MSLLRAMHIAAWLSLTTVAHAEIEYIMSENPPEANGEITGGVVISPHGRTSGAIVSDAPRTDLPMAVAPGALPQAEDAVTFEGIDSEETGGADIACPVAGADGLSAEQMIVRESPVDQWGAKLFHVSVDDSKYHGEPPAMVPAGWGPAALDRWYEAQQKAQGEGKHQALGLSCAAEIAVAFAATRSYWITFGGALNESSGGDPSALSKLTDSQRNMHQRKFTLLEVRMLKRNLKPIVSPALLSYFLGDQAGSRAFYADLQGKH